MMYNLQEVYIKIKKVYLFTFKVMHVRVICFETLIRNKTLIIIVPYEIQIQNFNVFNKCPKYKVYGL